MKIETVGTRELSAWLVAPGVTWVQTRSPQFARKLSQRSDSRLVAQGVAGGYLRIFEFRRGLAWAGRLIARYQTKSETATDAQVFVSALPVACRNSKTVKPCALVGQGHKMPKMSPRNGRSVYSDTEPRTSLGVYQESTGVVLFPPTGGASYG